MGAGGQIAPDGRPPQAKGVGKTAKRHDLEAPATPGFHGTDLQQGDVQMLEQSQRIAPRPKKVQPSGQAPARPQRSGAQRGSGQFSMQVPDPIELAGSRIGGNIPTPGAGRTVDPSAWVPFLQAIATSPNAGGALTSGLVDMLSQYVRRPVVSEAQVVDLNELDTALGA